MFLDFRLIDAALFLSLIYFQIQQHLAYKPPLRSTFHSPWHPGCPCSHSYSPHSRTLGMSWQDLPDALRNVGLAKGWYTHNQNHLQTEQQMVGRKRQPSQDRQEQGWQETF